MPDGLGRQPSDPATAFQPGPAPARSATSTGAGWDVDDLLLVALQDAVPRPPEDPKRLRTAAEWALRWRSLPQIAPATHCAWSRLDNDARTRSGDEGRRTLAFVAPPLGIEVELFRTRIVGQVIPPGEAQITLEADDGTTISVQADDLGFFVLPSRPAGAVRIICERPAARLVTDWVPSTDRLT